MHALALPRLAADALATTYKRIAPAPEAMTPRDYDGAAVLTRFALAAKTLQPAQLAEALAAQDRATTLARLLNDALGRAQEAANKRWDATFANSHEFNDAWVVLPMPTLWQSDNKMGGVFSPWWAVGLKDLDRHGEAVLAAIWRVLALIDAHLWPVAWPADLLHMSWYADELLDELESVIQSCGKDDVQSILRYLDANEHDEEFYHLGADEDVILQALSLREAKRAEADAWWGRNHYDLVEQAKNQPMAALDALHNIILAIVDEAWKATLNRIEGALRDRLVSDDEATLWHGRKEAHQGEPDEGYAFAHEALIFTAGTGMEDDILQQIYEAHMNNGEEPGIPVDVSTFEGCEAALRWMEDCSLAKAIGAAIALKNSQSALR